MLQVQFHTAAEFLQDIQKDRDLVQRSIVRVTVLRTVRTPSVGLYVLATAVVGGTLVRLKDYVGECFHAPGQEYRDLVAGAERLRSFIECQVRSMGLEPRAGFYE